MDQKEAAKLKYGDKVFFAFMPLDMERGTIGINELKFRQHVGDPNRTILKDSHGKHHCECQDQAGAIFTIAANRIFRTAEETKISLVEYLESNFKTSKKIAEAWDRSANTFRVHLEFWRNYKFEQAKE